MDYVDLSGDMVYRHDGSRCIVFFCPLDCEAIITLAQLPNELAEIVRNCEENPSSAIFKRCGTLTRECVNNYFRKVTRTGLVVFNSEIYYYFETADANSESLFPVVPLSREEASRFLGKCQEVTLLVDFFVTFSGFLDALPRNGGGVPQLGDKLKAKRLENMVEALRLSKELRDGVVLYGDASGNDLVLGTDQRISWITLETGKVSVGFESVAGFGKQFLRWFECNTEWVIDGRRAEFSVELMRHNRF